jgi:hypothetical protein
MVSLSMLRIALDPGHIGGEWAQLEQRWFQPPGHAFIVREGDLNLKVAELVRPMLEAAGAEVMLTRDRPQPVTSVRQDDPAVAGNPALFYRTAELRARAELLAEWQPDLVISIHFDARPATEDNGLIEDPWTAHVLVNGCYLPNETADPEVAMQRDLRSARGYPDIEIPLADAFGDAFASVAGLQPFSYSGPHACKVGDSPFTWARNLLANRIYPAPVIYLEPYVMNGDRTYARLAAGDYEGTREIMGRQEISIYREYAQIILKGLNNYLPAAKDESQRRP